jgi:glycosyltransferase involved in cell wall biosynthesis
VSVIVPFAGSSSQLERLRGELARLALRGGDEVIVADNRPGPIVGAGPIAGARQVAVAGRPRVVAAAGARAAGFARNQGALAARGDWLLFLDADVTVSPDLLDRYFAAAPDERTAVLAGAIVDRPGSDRFVARHAAGRGQMSQRVTLGRRGSPYAQSGNCAVRRTAFEAVGGFDARARSGEDADLCFRLTRAGWALEERPAAAVEHPTSATLAALVRQLARHGSGAAWLNRRYPGEFPPPRPRELAGRVVRAAVGGIAGLARWRPQLAAAAALELVATCAFDLGRLLGNDP